MAWKTVTITERGDPQWQGRQGPDPFKPRAHYFMAILFILGVLAIIGVCIWIAVDLKSAEKSTETAEVTPSTTTTVAAMDTSTTTKTVMPSTTTTSVPEVDVLLALQQSIGDPSLVKMSNFTNWDQTTKAYNLFMATPKNHTQIQNLVRTAKQHNLTVRATGAGMSYSNLFPDDGHILMDMTALKYRKDGAMAVVNNSFEIFPFSTVSVATGVTLKELAGFMAYNSVQINNNAAAMQVTVGGAISTASHGTAPNEPTMSDYVVGVEYVDSNGDTQFTSVSNPEDMSRIRCCLGLCGIIYDITFKVEPVKSIRLTQGFMSGSASIRNTSYMEHALAQAGFEMFMAPLSSLTDDDWAVYQSTGRVPDTYNPWDDEWWWRIMEDVTEEEVVGGQRRKRSAHDVDAPPLISGSSLLDSEMENLTTTASPEPTKPPQPHTALMVHKYAYDSTKIEVDRTPVLEGLYPDLAVHINATQLSKTYSVLFLIPARTGISVLERACNITFELTKQYLANGQHPWLTLESRWIKPSPDCVLCPTAFSNVSRVLTFEPISTSWKPEYFPFMTQLLAEFQKEWPEVRLSWSKFYETIPGMTDAIRYSMETQLSSMYDTSAGNVAFQQMFSTDLLQKLVNQ